MPPKKKTKTQSNKSPAALARADFRSAKKNRLTRFTIEQSRWAEAKEYVDTLLKLNMKLHEDIRDGKADPSDRVMNVTEIFNKLKKHFPGLPIENTAFRNWMRARRREAYNTVANNGREGQS